MNENGVILIFWLDVKKVQKGMFFGFSVRSPHRTTKPSRGWLRVVVRKPRLVLSEYRATRNKVTATPRSYVRGCAGRPASFSGDCGAKFPSSEARTSDTAKSDFPAELEVPGWRSRTCPSRRIQNKREKEKKSGFCPRFTRPAPIGGAGW